MASNWTKKKLLTEGVINTLEQNECVAKVIRSFHFLKVFFKTGIIEYWALNDEAYSKRKRDMFRLPVNKPLFTDHPIKIYKQFEIKLFDPDANFLENHFLVKEQDLSLAGWCDRRCFIHKLSLDLYKKGWKTIRYKKQLLEEDLEKVKSEPLDQYKSSMIRHNAFTKNPVGKRLILHFLNTKAKNNWSLYNIYKTIKNYSHGDITRESIVYKMSNNCHKIRHPGFYRAFFRKWYPIKGKRVLDLDPDWGFKSLGTIIDGGDYYCSDNPLLAELSSFVGNGHFKEHSHYDLILLNDVFPNTLEKLMPKIDKYRSLTDTFLITVLASERDEAIAKLNPWRILRLKNDPTKTANDDDYIIMIGQR